MQELLVETPEQLDSLCDQLRNSPWLAIDTEFLREKTYYPILCLIQISNGKVAACVDPQAITDLSPLMDVLFDTSIVKIFHAAKQDLEIFQNQWDKLPAPLFDTQPAAAILGYGDQIGYANLVKQSLGIDLAKGHSRTDWSARPLSKGQLRYALDDVVYLGDVYNKLKQELADKNRTSWLDQEFTLLENPSTYIQDPDTAWLRVKGQNRLRSNQRAVLKLLAAWREEQAVERNRPRRWILKDDSLLDMVKLMPTKAEQFERMRGLDGQLLKRHGQTLLNLIKQGAELPKDQWLEDPKKGKPLTDKQDALLDLLNTTLRIVATGEGMMASAIASRKQLETLVRGKKDSPLLDGWRYQVAGKTLVAMLEGKLSISVKNDQVVLVEL